MDDCNLQHALKLAQDLAATAQLFASTDFRNTDPRKKADGSDVTDTDLRIERLCAERIHQEFPTHALLAEEDTRQPENMPAPANARFCWVIDPLDGTRNYARGLACFTTSIALLDAGNPVVAVIRDLVTGTCYHAIKGSGAQRRGQPIRVSDRPFERHAMVTFQPRDDGSTYDRAPWIRQVHTRNFGTTALHLALVADGCVDGAICEQNRLWDVAAGTLLITEAGGVVTDLSGKPLTPFNLLDNPRGETAFLAGSPQAHAAMLAGMRPTG